MKPTQRKIIVAATWAVLVLGLMVCLSFVNTEQEQMRCKSLEVKILPEDNYRFITREAVIAEITDRRGEAALLGEPLATFNVGQLEEQLEQNPFIGEAEVFIDIEGNLRVDVVQRKPIIRIMKTDGSGFYIDEDGLKMPLSDSFTAHVPIATGNIFEKIKNSRDSLYSKAGRELFELGKYLDGNPFWKAMVDQVEVNAKNEIIIIPKIADHKVVLGTTERLDEKLTKLRIFYKKGLNKMGWNKYKVINLKYTGQIVCEK